MRKFSTWLVVTSCLAMMTFGIQIYENAHHWVQSWGDGLQMSVYINPDIKSIDEIKTTIFNLAEVKTVQIVSPEQSFKDFQVQMASFGSLSLTSEEIIQSIPASLLVEVKSDGNQSLARFELLQQAAQQIQKIAGVQSVDYGQGWVQKFAELVQGFQYLAVLLGGLLFLTASYVIFNSIQVLVLEKRNEIEILELLGADANFIQMPFVKQGFILGFLAALSAVAVNMGLVIALKSSMSTHSVLVPLVSQIQNMPWELAAAILFFGSVLGFVSSYVCVRKINTGWLAAGQA